MFKWTKRIVAVAILGGITLSGVAYLFSNTHAMSYISSTGNMLQKSVKESIPIEFEIQRARDLLEDLLPEMRANLKLVAAEQVEVAELEEQIRSETDSIALEKRKVQILRNTLKQAQASYRIGNLDYDREEVVEELARRFEHLRTAELLLTGKRDLLRNRKRSLEAAMKKLEKTRVSRVTLESQIESLEAQFRLLQAQSTESEFHLDESKLTQTQDIIDDLKRRLEVSRRVLAQESRFVEMIPVEGVEETSVVQRVDQYLEADSDRDATVVRLEDETH